jgi:hypothetical protein
MSTDNRELVIIDSRVIDFVHELAHPAHVELSNRLVSKYTDEDLHLILVEVCTYVGIIVDGDYTEEDLCCIAEKCTARLKDKRVNFVHAVID